MTAKYLEALKNHIYGPSEESLLNGLAVGLSMSLVAVADNRITKEEVRYMRREIKTHVDLDDEQMQLLVDFCLGHVIQRNFRWNELTEFLPHLKTSLNILQKQDLITSLFIISRSDLEMSREENKLIERIALEIDLEQEMTQLLEKIQQTILDNKLNPPSDEYEIVHGADKFNL